MEQGWKAMRTKLTPNNADTRSCLVVLRRAYDLAELGLERPGSLSFGGQDTFVLTDEGSSQFEAQLSMSGGPLQKFLV